MEKIMHRLLLLTLAVLGVSGALSSTLAAEGNPDRGQRVFNACAACHSLEQNRNMTGPSLAELWNRKAGSLSSFPRYSPALKSSGVVWNDKTLNDWIKNPQRVIPDNDMTFQGIENDQQRADLLVYLKQATQPGHATSQSAQQGGQMGGMMGGMTGGGDLNLKTVGPEKRVQSISYCRDTYRMTTADGNTRAFWERNLRLMIDSSENGPPSGAPALVGAGMMGDRADAIFAVPEEISGFIKHEC
jgi:cytochrome c